SAQRFLPNAAMARANKRTVLEVRAAGVLRSKADVRLDDADLALLDDQHRNELDADEERVQRISAVEQRIMLEADVAAVIQKCLEVLIVVVQMVLAAKKRFDDLRVVGIVSFHSGDVGKSAEPAGDIAGRKGIAFVGCDDADHVYGGAVFAARL